MKYSCGPCESHLLCVLCENVFCNTAEPLFIFLYKQLLSGIDDFVLHPV